MIPNHRWAFKLAATLGAVVGMATANGFASGVAGKVHADRKVIGFRDQGLYCNFGPLNGPSTAHGGKKDLLPSKRAATTAPWSFYIMQFDADLNPHFNPAAPHPYKQLIPDMVRHGKRVILRVALFQGGAGPLRHPGDIGFYFHRLAQTLQAIKPRWLYAVTLDEENIFWYGHAKILAGVYRLAKKRWPNLPVYQWWTPMEGIDWTGHTGWKALPADGWICDLYTMARGPFEKHVISFLHTGKPLVAILWASPDWVLRAPWTPKWALKNTPTAVRKWWKRTGAPALRGELEVCRAYNIPVAYFACQQALFQHGKKIHPIYWAWKATDPITRSFYQTLELHAQEYRFIPNYALGYRAVTPAMVRWSQGTPGVKLHLARTAAGAIRAVWIDHLRTVALSFGRHRRPHPNPYVAISYRIGRQTARDFDPQYTGTGFAVASVAKRAIHAAIILKIKPCQPVSRLATTLDLDCIKALGGSYEIRSSGNGRHWSKPVVGNHGGRVAIPGPTRDRPNKTPLYIQLTLTASAGVPTATACALTSLEVTGIYP